MAKVKGPLFSEHASGKFGSSLIFTEGRFPSVHFNTPRQKWYSIPTNVTRTLYGYIIAEWRICSPDIVSYYTALSKGKPLTAVNLFFKDIHRYIFYASCGESTCGYGRCRQ